MEGFVYILCAIAATACSTLLFRHFFRSHTRLLLWCGLFFAALALENAMLFIDIVLVPDTDLSLVRRAIPLVGVSLLLYGLVFDIE